MNRRNFLGKLGIGTIATGAVTKGSATDPKIKDHVSDAEGAMMLGAFAKGFNPAGHPMKVRIEDNSTRRENGKLKRDISATISTDFMQKTWRESAIRERNEPRK